MYKLLLTIEIGWMLSKRTLLADIRTSKMGLLWPLIYPLAYTGLFLTLKPVLQADSHVDVRYALHIFVGLSLWQLWFEGLQAQMRAVKSQKSLLSRADLSTGSLFLSGLFVEIVYLLPRLALASIVAVGFGILQSFGNFLLFFALSTIVILNGSVVGFVLQPFSTLLPDVFKVVQSFSLALMLTGGVFTVFPQEMSDIRYFFIVLNPLAPLIDVTRASLFNTSPQFLYATYIWIAATIVLLAAQLRISKKVLPVLLERIGS